MLWTPENQVAEVLEVQLGSHVHHFGNNIADIPKITNLISRVQFM